MTLQLSLRTLVLAHSRDRRLVLPNRKTVWGSPAERDFVTWNGSPSLRGSRTDPELGRAFTVC